MTPASSHPSSQSPSASPSPPAPSASPSSPSSSPPPAAAKGLALAPDVRLTWLPYGGAVLLHGRTLALAECDERDAALLGRLLAGERPDPDDPEALRVVRDLMDSRWLQVTDVAK
ncbi:actinodefensin-associated protein B [Streptomyces marispadix]|uniref:Actinodefensin-associated protein B n=1 Tax=Streptomyces marispadix TaxID=2922868 RepID=A0ABS9T4A2_9ACTN|nr:actinodefensin-associated protein B [Streptomyces marispadix]MCH6163101.1 actinodefensin-associated protein B [Streptomyces marispadix]